MGQFSHHHLSVSQVVQSVPLQFEVKLFMNQLVVAVQLEANIIGQQLWIGSFFARPCCKRGLVCQARTFCHSSANVRIRISCTASSVMPIILWLTGRNIKVKNKLNLYKIKSMLVQFIIPTNPLNTCSSACYSGPSMELTCSGLWFNSH